MKRLPVFTVAIAFLKEMSSGLLPERKFENKISF
jgi:hypothetical protein